MEKETSHRPHGWRRVTLAATSCVVLLAVCTYLAGAEQGRRGERRGAAAASLLETGAIAGDIRVAAQLTGARARYEEASRRVAALHAKFDKLQQELGKDIGQLNDKREDLGTQIRDASGVLGDKAPLPAAGGVSEPSVPAGTGTAAGAGKGGLGSDWWYGGAEAEAEAEAEAVGSLHRTLALEQGVRAAASRVAGAERGAEAARSAMREAVRHAKGLLRTGVAATLATVHGARYAGAASRVVKKYVGAVFKAEQGAEDSEWRADEASKGAQSAEAVAKASLGAAVGAADQALR
eukprot:CAMPEP_0174936234 /NCGR_PEP_ID=MMETSP1355-20121228/56747_1 /TAXON_ID=464990 /ORGANISM="Hemiselmis tepida, Strain CCMP443" /LENGTH=292 /DNA_ID=CAMNT_0016182999 /DNA_START=12 /DNA_END=887 /DNA_ORIENTATION=+